MKKDYDMPEISVTKFRGEDVIMVSGVNGTQDGFDELEMDFT